MAAGGRRRQFKGSPGSGSTRSPASGQILRGLRRAGSGPRAIPSARRPSSTWSAPTYQQGRGAGHERLYERREGYQRGMVPTGALILTAGVDVQRDRLEVEVVAWGRGLESWSVTTGSCMATRRRTRFGGNSTRCWARRSGTRRAANLSPAGDRHGFETHRVYDWRRRHGDNRVDPGQGLRSPAAGPGPAVLGRGERAREDDQARRPGLADRGLVS